MKTIVQKQLLYSYTKRPNNDDTIDQSARQYAIVPSAS